jgi:hypothetical protein
MSVIATTPPTGILELVKRGPALARQAPMAPARPQSSAGPPSPIAVIGNYLPRHSGMGTFTKDLCGGISAEYASARLLELPSQHGIWI